jgi:hypothetical protein
MKKVILSLAIFATASLISCGSPEVEAEKSTADSTLVDSAAIVTGSVVAADSVKTVDSVKVVK